MTLIDRKRKVLLALAEQGDEAGLKFKESLKSPLPKAEKIAKKEEKVEDSSSIALKHASDGFSATVAEDKSDLGTEKSALFVFLYCGSIVLFYAVEKHFPFVQACRNRLESIATSSLRKCYGINAEVNI